MRERKHLLFFLAVSMMLSSCDADSQTSTITPYPGGNEEPLALATEQVVPRVKNEFDFLRERGMGVWNREEMARASIAMQSCPGQVTRSRGVWLQEFSRQPSSLQDLRPFLDELEIKTGDTKEILGTSTLATTQIFRQPEEDKYRIEITIDPKVFGASDEATCWIVAKELHNVFALVNSGIEHRGLISKETEADFWRFISSEDSGVQEALIVLGDGRAYWEMLEDYKQTLESLGDGSYGNLNFADQEMLGSVSILSRLAIGERLIVDQGGRWVQNPSLEFPGYLSGEWTGKMFELVGFPS